MTVRLLATVPKLKLGCLYKELMWLSGNTASVIQVPCSKLSKLILSPAKLGWNHSFDLPFSSQLGVEEADCVSMYFQEKSHNA